MKRNIALILSLLIVVQILSALAPSPERAPAKARTFDEAAYAAVSARGVGRFDASDRLSTRSRRLTGAERGEWC